MSTSLPRGEGHLVPKENLERRGREAGGEGLGAKSCHKGLGLDSRLSCILKARESPVLIRGNADAVVEASWVWGMEETMGAES